jgi:hypothetical protein
MKHSIAIKIFSLSVGVLIMMILAAVLNSIQVIHLGNQVRDISTSGIPIATHAAQLNESGLRRRIAFERLYREYQMASKDSSVITEAETNFEKFTILVSENLVLLRSSLSKMPESPDDRELYAQAREIATEIESIFAQQTDIARRILAKAKQGELNGHHDLLEINMSSQSTL